MTPRVTVRACHINATPPRSGDGLRLYLARITAEVGPVLLVGCTLGVTIGGSRFLQLPAGGRDRRVFIQDRTLHAELLGAAWAAYKALGGPALHIAAPPLATAPELEHRT